MTKKRMRASRLHRLKNPPPMRLTNRDIETVKVINDFRVMRQDQVERLLYPSKNTAQRRLWLLWQHSYLKRTFLPVIAGVQTSPILYLIDKRGVELLQSHYNYTKEQLRYSRKKQVSSRFLEHTLGLAEIRLSVELSCQHNLFAVFEWQDEKKIKSDYDRVDLRGRRAVAILPDAYFKIQINGQGKSAFYLHFFVEYDRGGEQLSYFRRKVQAYNIYFQSGKCVNRYGTNRIRVLTITEGGVTRKGRGRHKSVQDIAKDSRAKDWFWFTSLEDVIKEDFLTASIWEQSHDDELRALI